MKPITLRWKRLSDLDYIDVLYTTSYKNERIVYLPKDRNYVVFSFQSENIRAIIDYIDKRRQ